MTPAEEAVQIAELRLMRKHLPDRWTPQASLELMKLERAAELRRQASDEIAEENAEGRIPSYHSLRSFRSGLDR